jgi:hypothetical protein
VTSPAPLERLLAPQAHFAQDLGLTIATSMFRRTVQGGGYFNDVTL